MVKGFFTPPPAFQGVLGKCEQVHNRVVRIELSFVKPVSGNLEMAHETASRNLEIPIAICMAGIVYFALLYSVILYL
jgi:hypothetical protein